MTFSLSEVVKEENLFSTETAEEEVLIVFASTILRISEILRISYEAKNLLCLAVAI